MNRARRYSYSLKACIYIHSDGDSILLLFIFAQKPLQRVTDGFQLATPLLTKDYDFPALAEKLSSDMHPHDPSFAD